MKRIGKILKNHWKKFLLLIIIIAIIAGIIYLSFRAYNRYRENLLTDPAWIRENVNLVENDEGVYVVEKDEDISIFSEDYQNIIEEKIDALKDSADYTLEDPLLIYNPYGTGALSYYLYYTDSEEDLDYKIETKGYSNFEREISHKDSNEYQLIGFVPGQTNTLTLTSGDQESNFTITTPKSEAKIDIKLEVVDGESEEELTDGLFTVLGHDKNYNSNIYLYDNEGVLREEFVLDSYRADRIIFDDDYMYYAYNKKGIV